ncbi:hypothetical protein [Clostridium sp.]|uniref:hypothetical protein n=1 Tax=Clostridium sp. TaxID=1506 RepID=UPI003D6D5B14
MWYSFTQYEITGKHFKGTMLIIPSNKKIVVGLANDKPTVTEGDGGWGIAPRTAIGQKKDGESSSTML